MNLETPITETRPLRIPGNDPSMLIVDSDHGFAQRLGRIMEQRGFHPRLVSTLHDAMAEVTTSPPGFALVDLRLPDGSGLEVVTALHEKRPTASIVVLTAYGNIATAVSAVKKGAVDYLCKPSSTDDILSALLQNNESRAVPPDNPMSADRVRWEHIQRIFELYGHNVSETARRLSMHRRTLQRILAKNAPR
ncbi:ActR/PrrA/RegA family redox response regulator transcription factor [Aureimonas fodinaquatilis]|uniref:ActR/PrrA/RegA family redox response regulator transcription factor n=1 Tax=Aureimonas fodinaquatilis TaxID=2565783 RepID=A0A5B0DPT4_9HYPH|nr:ActR/PrrA/RegA family redox response regulator transcription factor [Aureimonas fodinaquatilis]KAA0968486.1 ActR/PrrA/RegA family redox response regulator transcription factor [Aureimonas fodinaquatilis]